MPGKRKYGKRKGAKRNRRVRKTVNVNRALQPIAQRYICKMKYAESVNIDIPALGLVGVTRFNLNSIFDPNRTGVGTQPYSHDTFQSMYNRYRVISCSYKVSIFNTTNLTSEPIQLTTLPANEEVSIGTGAEGRMNPRAKYIIQGPTGSPIRYLTGRVHLPSLVGRNKSQYMADDRYQAQFGASPSELAILNIYSSLMNDGQVASARVLQASVELTYTVECFDVKNLSPS